MPRNLEKITKQQQIHEELTRRIFTGELPSGALLPTFSELGAEFNASRWTINAAIRMLEHDGLIRTRSSRPARVCWQTQSDNREFPHRRIALIGNAVEPSNFFSYHGSPHGWMLYRALIRETSLLGWGCVCVPYSNYEQALQRGEQIDGVVLFSGSFKAIKHFQASQTPHILILPNEEIDGCCYLTVDYTTAMEQSALYFLSNGVKSIFIYGFKPECMPRLCQCREAHFDQMLEEHNISADNITHIDGEYWERSGREAMEKILHTRPPLPMGLLAIGDFCARGMVQVAMRYGLRPKQDFFIISMTDLEEAAHWSPALSVQSCPFDKIAQRVLNILERNIITNCLQPSEKIPSVLTIRDT